MRALRVTVCKADRPAAAWYDGLEPPGEMAPLPYVASFSASEYSKMRRGFIPQDMDDKWYIYMDADDLFVHRASSGVCVYHVQFRELDGQHVVDYAEVVRDRWMDAEKDARHLESLICHGLLGKEPQ